MIRTLRLLIATVAVALPFQVKAAGKVEGVVYHEVAPASLNPNSAYLLFTSSRAKSGVMTITHAMLRVPSEPELADFRKARLAAYQKALPKLKKQAKGGPVVSLEEFDYRHDGPANLFAFDLGKTLGKPADDRDGTYFVEVPPGEYVFYGIGVGTRSLTVCNCLGTVRFEAKAGEITQLGGLYADKSHNDSPIPHIEDELGEDMVRYGFVLSQAVVPARDDASVPPALAAFPRRIARYDAVGPFQDSGASGINRLAPIPGVLEYERGRILMPGSQ